MKAIRAVQFGPPDVLRLEDVPAPAPNAGEVLVRVKAAGVNPVETYMRSGTYTRLPPLPWTPGTDAAGIVEAVGAGVGRVKPGDRVYTAGSATGTYAELAICREEHVHALPPRLSFAQGAAIGVPYATAWRGLMQKARAQPGETVLVHGATGGVGSAAVQIAAAHGMRVIGTGGTDVGRATVAAHGAVAVLDHTKPGYLDALPALTDGRGPDVILEMLADRNLDADLGVVAMRGRVVVIGSRGTIVLDPRKAITRDATVLGMSLFNATASELAEIHAALAAGLASGALTPVVGRELPLADAARAHEEVMRPGAAGKIVLVP
jgi:NADPH2:quinone reductase